MTDRQLPYCYAVSLVESDMGTVPAGSVFKEERLLSKSLWNKTVYADYYIRLAYSDSTNGSIEEPSVELIPMADIQSSLQAIRIFRVVSIQLKPLLHSSTKEPSQGGRISKRTLFRILSGEEVHVATTSMGDDSSHIANEVLIPLQAFTEELKDHCESLDSFDIRMVEAHMDSGILSVLRQMYSNRWSQRFVSHEISPLSLLSCSHQHSNNDSNDKTYAEIILENFKACLTDIKSSINTNTFDKDIHVLIFKDIDVLFPSLASSALSSSASLMTETLVSFLDYMQSQSKKINRQKLHIKVIGLTNNVQRVHEGVYNRFVMNESKNVLLVEKLDVAERKELTSQLGYPDALFQDIAREITNKHAMEIVSLVSAYAKKREREVEEKGKEERFVIFQEDFMEMLQKDIIYTFKYPRVYNHFLSSSQSSSELNMSIHGLLLYGPPGTGKTLYASHLSNLLKYSFVEVKITDVVRGELGSGEQTLINKLQEAKRCAPCILFIDEFQAIFTQRDTDQSSSSSPNSPIDRDNVGSSLSSTLAGVFDEINVWNKFNNAANIAPILLVATTNEPWAIDSAFLRAGRFDRIVFVPPLASSNRQDFILKKMHILFSHDENKDDDREFNQLMEDITKHTPDFSGADMQLLLSTAERDGFNGNCNNQCLFLKKMVKLLKDEKIQPSTEASEMTKYLSWNSK